ncbi:hypothetical protein NDU88_008454 [Pleurodeles waltl]|uniref:Uncharacterized protein n=1 Tax=Pleurodeles waltl TaxID=8319 RepID=A0AAV7PUE6_PLEWA|nr:hypothetical protein NDU88_008454 [Pleurodeles waltl]
MVVELGLRRADHSKLTDRLGEAEKEVQQMQPTIKEYEKQLSNLRQEVGLLQDRVEDGEGRSPHNHVRAVGLPERSNGLSIQLYILNKFMRGKASQFFTAQSAPRVPGAQPRSGGTSRINSGPSSELL